MAGCCLSSSPNWYCPKILDYNASCGLFAFGSRNSIVLFTVSDIQKGDSSRPVKFIGVLRFHTDRVSSLAFCNVLANEADEAAYLASVGDDLAVNVVDVNTRTLLVKHHEHQARVSSVCWASLNGVTKLVLSGDEKGFLVLFNITTNKTKRYVPNKAGGGGSISVLSCNPLQARFHVVAVGYHGGLILIVDLRNDVVVLHRLSHHDGDIQSLSWAPNEGRLNSQTRGDEDPTVSPDNVSGEDHLLASGSKDRKIKIWSTKDGVPMRTLHLPTSAGAAYRKASGDENAKSRVWISVAWRSSATLLTSSHFGELLSWDLNDNGKQPWVVLGQKESRSHTRAIFNIVTDSTLACTVSLDRQICIWDVGQKVGRCLHSIPTLGGYVTGLTFSPINSGYLAIGCGDNMIRTWNMMTANDAYDVQKFWQGIKSKVTTLAWHPYKEGILGFGTDEGRVGVYNVLTSKPPSLSMNFHRKVVYTVTWGPMCPSVKDQLERDFRLYSCGDGIILLHNPKAMEKPASNLNKLISSANCLDAKPPGRSDIAFNPDFGMLIVGNEDGNVELYESGSLKLCALITGVRKLIQCIRWHPKYTLSSSDESKCSFWLAVASRDVTLRVYDLRERLQGAEGSVTLGVPSFELVGHNGAVSAVAWNPHLEGQLASASFDGIVRVWNVFKMETMACYCGHLGRVLCIVWDPITPGQVLSGGDDNTVHLWNVFEQEKEPKTQRNVTKGSRREVGPSRDDVSETSDVMGQIAKLLEQRKQEILSEGSTAIQTVGRANVAEGTKVKAAMKSEGTAKKQKKKPNKSLFPVSNSKDNCGKTPLLMDCELLADKLAGTVDDGVQFGSGDFVSLGAFGGRLDAYRLIKSEAENHAKSDSHDCEMHLEVWKGNVEGALRNAARKEQLTDWLVAMAPIVSPSFWEEMCGLYSKQLVTDGQPHKAAAYLLANLRVNEAIEVLKNHVSYRDAIVLAKVRLSPSDPLVNVLMEEWADQLAQKGSAEQAAKCYLAVGQSDRAARVLSQRQDQQSLRVAAHIALRSEDLESAFVYATRSAYESLARQDGETVDQLIVEHPKLKPFRLVAVSHRLLCECCEEFLVLVGICKWRRPEIDLMRKIRSEWMNSSDLSRFLDDEEFLNECIVCLTQDVFVANSHRPPQMLALVAIKLTLALVYAFKQRYLDCLEVIQSYLLVVQRNCDQNVVRWLFEFVFMSHDGTSASYGFIDFDGDCNVWLNSMDDDSRRTFLSLCGSVDAYGELAQLHVVLNAERQRLDLPEEDNECDVASTLERLTAKLLSEEHAEYSRLRLRLEYIRMTVAALVAKQKWAAIPGREVDSSLPSDFSQMLADQILECPSITTDQLGSEVQNVEEQLENARKKLTVEQFPDPFDSCCLLAECCSLVMKRRSDSSVTELIAKVVEFGVKYSAITKQKTKMEQFLQGALSL